MKPSKWLFAIILSAVGFAAWRLFKIDDTPEDRHKLIDDEEWWG